MTTRKFRHGGLGVLVVLASSMSWAAPAASEDARLANAVENQDRALVRTLLKQHVNPNSAQVDRTTALMWAAHWNDAETVDLLLAAGADAKAVSRYNTSALSESARSYSGSTVVFEKLLKAGADPNTVAQNNESVLMTMALAGSVDGVKLLLDRGANMEARDTKEQETPLLFAVAAGNTAVVKLLISKGANVNAVAHTLDIPRRPQPTANFGTRVSGGFTALMFAARQDNVDCARLLLDAGANPNVSDRDGMTPMIIAALNGSFETAALLLEKGADPNDGSLWETMDFRNFKGEEDDHIMPEITSKLAAVDFAKMLLDHGADPTKPYGKVRTTHRQGGTNLGGPTNTSALDRALDAVDVDSIRLMLDHAVAKGISFDVNGMLTTELRAYSSIGPGKMIFRVVTAQDVTDAVALALDHGADANTPNLLGNTPLHLAAQQGADDLVKLLVAKGAKIDAKNKAGLTPLDFAMGKGGAIGGGGRRGQAADEGAPTAPGGVHESTVALLRQMMASPSALNAAPARQ